MSRQFPLALKLHDRDELSERLILSFSNHLSLGQWELARAFFQHILQVSPQLAGDILLCLIQSPRQCPVRSLRDFHTENLPWLALGEYMTSSVISETVFLDRNCQRRLEFQLLLQSAGNDIPPTVLLELLDYHAALHNDQSKLLSSLPSFSSSCMEILRKIFVSFPSFGHEVVHELTRSQGVCHETLEQLFIEVIQDELLSISVSPDIASDECAQHILRVYHLLSMMNPSAEMKNVDLDGLFTDLIQAMLGVTIAPDLIRKPCIYSCLLGRSSDYVVTRFCEVENHMWNSQTMCATVLSGGSNDQEVVETQIVDMSKTLEQNIVWKELFHQVMSNGYHVLEHIVELGVSLVYQGRFVELAELLSREDFNPLRPLLLLLGWSHCHTVDAAGSLLDAIWLSHDADHQHLLFVACEKLAYQTQLVQWCLEKTRPLMLTGTSLNGSTTFSDMFDGLEGHSVLYVLHCCTPLAALAPDDVIELLQKQPLSTPVPSPVLSQASPSSGPSTPILNDEGSFMTSDNLLFREFRRSSSIASTAEKERDVALYQGFYAVQSAIDAVRISLQVVAESVRRTSISQQVMRHNAPLYEEAVLGSLKKAKEALSQVYPLTYRVELLENIFSLLFLKVGDFHKMRTDDDSDEATTKQSSTVALEGSEASTSETYFGESVSGHSVSLSSVRSLRSTEQFAVSESVAQDLLDMLKGCLIDLDATKFAQHRGAHAPASHWSLGGLSFTESDDSVMSFNQTNIMTSVSVQDLQQRLARLNQYVNEAKWRLQLVCMGVSSPEHCKGSLFSIGLQDSDSDISEIVTDEEETFDGSLSDSQYEKKDSQFENKNNNSQITTSERADERKRKRKFDENSTSVHLSTEDGDQSDSGGEGDTEETEGKKPMIKKKQKRCYSRSPRSEHIFSMKQKSKSALSGIISRMLSSPDTLLQLCLRNSNYDRAEEVIRMFGLEDTVSGHAVMFADRLDIVSLQLAGAMSKSQTQQTTKKLKTMVAEQSSLVGSQQSSCQPFPDPGFGSTEVDTLEELLSSSISPRQFPFVGELSEELFKLSSSLPSLILLDLACSSCSQQKVCLDILNMAVDRLQALENIAGIVHTVGSSIGPIVFLNMIHRMMEKIEEPHTYLRQFLNQGTVPLGDDLWTTNHESALWKRASQEQVRMEMLAMESVLVTEMERADAGHKSPLREAMETLLKSFADDTDSHASYIRTLFTHADNLSSLLIRCDSDSNELDLTRRAYNPLAVLKEGPTVTLERLLFEKCLQPEKLEEIAYELSLNLVKIIVDCCCPCISVVPVECIVTEKSYVMISDVVPVVLNKDVREVKKDDVSLSNLDIDLMTKFVSYLQGTAKAAGVSVFDQRLIDESRTNASLKNLLALTSLFNQFDMSTLKTPVEELCFFANVFNLMMIHGALVVPLQTVLRSGDLGHCRQQLSVYGSKSKAERLLYMQHIAYHINGLGIVSAFDIYFHVLRAGLPLPDLFGPGLCDMVGELPHCVPLKKYCSQKPNPYLLFALTLGTVSSPFPQVFRPNSVESNLRYACLEFLEEGLTVDVAGGTVTLPGQLKWFVSDFSTSESSELIDGRRGEVLMLNFFKDMLSTSKATLLETLLQETSHDSASTESFLLAKKKLKIIYNSFNCSVGFTLTPSFVNTYNLPLPRTMKSRDLTIDVTANSQSINWKLAKLPGSKHKMTNSTSQYLASKAGLFWVLAILLQPPTQAEDVIGSESESDEESGVTQTVTSKFKRVKHKFIRTNFVEKQVPVQMTEPVSLVQCFLKDHAPALSKFPALQHHVKLRLCALVPPHNCVTNRFDLSDIQMLIFEDRMNQNISSAVLCLLDMHISCGQWDGALRLIESECCLNNHGEVRLALDAVLAGLLLSSNRLAQDFEKSSARELWKFAARIGNSERAATIVLSHLKEWTPLFCIDVLSMCKSRLVSSHLVPTIDRTVDEMSIYLEMTREMNELSCTSQPKSVSWVSYRDDPQQTLQHLLQLKSFSSAKRWIRLRNLGQDALLNVEQQLLIEHLEGNFPDYLKAHIMLNELVSSNVTTAFCLAEKVLHKVLQLRSKVFMLEFILDKLRSHMTKERRDELANLCLGVKALCCIPEAEHEHYKSLIKHPELLFEQLLMNVKVDWASNVLASWFSNDLASHTRGVVEAASINELVVRYAYKALEFPTFYQGQTSSWLDSVTSSRMGSPTDFVTSRKSTLSSTQLFTASTKRTTSSSFGSSGLLDSVAVSTLASGFCQPSFGSMVQLPDVVPTREEWMKDEEVAACVICVQRFSMFNRRHHCRRCGRVVCADCSSHNMVVPTYGDSPVRVCKQCYEHATLESEKNIHANFSERPDDQSFPTGSGGSGEQDYGKLLTEDFEKQNVWLLDPSFPDQCDDTRKQFSFDQAPSTALCISLLELHSDAQQCALSIIKLCRTVSLDFVSIKREIVNQEVDHNLVIQMISHLLFTAKMKFLDCGDNSGVELCDSYIATTDILRHLVSAESVYIPSLDDLLQSDTAWRLRDKLLEDDRFTLAREVSTKCNLDVGAVWAAWGMASLRAGKYEEAREKFKHCLGRSTEVAKSYSMQQRLVAIIEFITTTPYIDPQSTPDAKETIPAARRAGTVKLDSARFAECLYYMQTYGSDLMLVEFYVRHNYLRKACMFVLDKKCSSDVFVEGLLVPSLRYGLFTELKEELLSVGGTVDKWENYLAKSCQYFEAKHLYAILYKVQLFMKDYVRAAMTCIKFFTGACGCFHGQDLYPQLPHLHRASKHLETYVSTNRRAQVNQIRGTTVGRWEKSRRISGIYDMQSRSEDPQPVAHSGSRLTIPVGDAQKQIDVIKLQVEVTTYLHTRGIHGASAGDAALPSSKSTERPATLFGRRGARTAVVCKVLLESQNIKEGFDLAFRLIQYFSIQASRVYSFVGETLAQEHRIQQIEQLLDCINSSGLRDARGWDEILNACINVLAKDKREAKATEKFIDRLINSDNKIDALVRCGKLKNAYLVAVREKRIEQVERIADLAQKSGEVNIYKICDKYLESQREERLLSGGR